MENSTVLLVIFGVLALASAIAILWLSRLRAARRWQGERRMQAVLDAFAEREIARERLRNAARRIRKSSPHGTILQDLSFGARPIPASRNRAEAHRNLASLRLGKSPERE